MRHYSKKLGDNLVALGAGAMLFLLVWSVAHAHTHSWQKQSESTGVDNFGNAVIVCNWVCMYDYPNQHYATTSGQMYCPHPL